MNIQARAFVLGMGVTGLEAVRSLGEVGIRITGVDTTRWAPEFFSRYCEPLVCPNPDTEPERVLELLLAAGRKLDRPAVLLPTSDAFVLFMSRYRAELGQWFLFALPPPSVAEGLVDKQLQYEMAERAGIPCPRVLHPSSKADIAYPVFLKPRVSHLWAPVFVTKGFRIDGPADLERRLAEIAPSGLDVIIQSIVPGPNSNHYIVRAYIDDSNRALGLYVERKIRQYPTDFGNATMVESVRAPDATELGVALLQQLQYRGLAGIEFKRDARSGELTLIEVNPRLGLKLILATRCGVNFPLLAYLDLTGQKPAPQTEYRLGVRYLVSVGKDFRAFLDYHRRGELSPVEWARSVARARVYSYLDWRDPLPFLIAAGRGFWRLLLHFRRRAARLRVG
jgi:D-aspartate ligase